ncbi:MAG: HAD family phosphatase [Actinomycetota bacterium]
MSDSPTVVFDLGGVLIDWDPRHLYRKLIPDEAEMEHFLAEVCTMEWHQRHDAGRSFEDGVAEAVERHPEHRELIEAWHHRFPEMVPGALPETVALLGDVVALGEPVYALTNWSADAWPMAVERFDFLSLFDGIVVSGHEGVIKPDRLIFERLLDRYGLEAADTVFIDDWDRNVDGARAAGLQAIQFHDAGRLRRDLRALGVAV